MKFTILTVTTTILVLNNCIQCCDFENIFSEKEVSIEDAISISDIVFHGLSTPLDNLGSSIFTAYFDLITTYKGTTLLKEWGKLNNYYRKINVTFLTRPPANCATENEVPREYIVFANLMDDEIRAASVTKWEESADQRVWKALGWSKWSDWSACSVSCSSGIQQRTRHCLQGKCCGFNVQQRHCNLFSCNNTVTPLSLKEGQFFHPSRDRWQSIPDRPTAWRLTPNSYIWIPAALLFSQNEAHNFPREFSLAMTLRIQNEPIVSSERIYECYIEWERNCLTLVQATIGTVFSLRSRSRQDTYLSLEVAGSDLKLIHAAVNGTDVVRIPAKLNDAQWHQVAISIRDDSIVDTYVDCEWSRTDILHIHSLDVPDDCDIIIGYLFKGDLEQLSIISDPHSARLQCSSVQIPIEDPDVRYTKDGFKLFARKGLGKSRKNRS